MDVWELSCFVVDNFIRMMSDMEFVKNFKPTDFQAKNFTLSISPNFNSFSYKNTKKISENGENYTAGNNFTLPPAVTAFTNSTSASRKHLENMKRTSIEYLEKIQKHL